VNRSTLRVVVVFPDLLGTYGDGGNGVVLAQRAAWRGIDVALVEAPSHAALPEGDLYCLGGGEDGPQVRAAETLFDDGTLLAAAGRGAVIFAVCAGYQIVGRRFPGSDGRAHEGLGLLDVDTVKGTGSRAVGEVVAQPRSEENGSTLPTLSGFENHGGITAIGSGAAPLATVSVGVGNGGGDRTEGARAGRVLGTYLHGPVLARNPALADLLLGWALDVEGPLNPLDDDRESALRRERLGAARHRSALGRRRR
jgi:lipid II isoglutaminyl synthase (glutamine-hydrolysing)